MRRLVRHPTMVSLLVGGTLLYLAASVQPRLPSEGEAQFAAEKALAVVPLSEAELAAYELGIVYQARDLDSEELLEEIERLLLLPIGRPYRTRVVEHVLEEFEGAGISRSATALAVMELDRFGYLSRSADPWWELHSLVTATIPGIGFETRWRAAREAVAASRLGGLRQGSLPQRATELRREFVATHRGVHLAACVVAVFLLWLTLHDALLAWRGVPHSGPRPTVFSWVVLGMTGLLALANLASELTPKAWTGWQPALSVPALQLLALGAASTLLTAAGAAWRLRQLPRNRWWAHALVAVVLAACASALAVPWSMTWSETEGRFALAPTVAGAILPLLTVGLLATGMVVRQSPEVARDRLLRCTVFAIVIALLFAGAFNPNRSPRMVNVIRSPIATPIMVFSLGVAVFFTLRLAGSLGARWDRWSMGTLVAIWTILLVGTVLLFAPYPARELLLPLALTGLGCAFAFALLGHLHGCIHEPTCERTRVGAWLTAAAQVWLALCLLAFGHACIALWRVETLGRECLAHLLPE